MFNYYYNQSIRKLVVAFGSLFNRIYVVQNERDGTTRSVPVPLTYAPKEKFVKRITQSSSISETTRIGFAIPQMSFEMTGLAYDATRRLNKTNKRIITGGSASAAFSEAPYNFGFSLYCYTRNIEENLEVMEQILPQFTPEFVVSLNFNGLHQKVDVPITLMQAGLIEEYEGDFSTRRSIISTYQFVAKSYVYGEIKTTPGITAISSTIFNISGITLA